MDKGWYQVPTVTTSQDPLASQHPELPTMDMSYRIDEGYSEETRSLDDLESPMRLEVNTEEMVPTSLRLAMDTIMSLEESDKAGMNRSPAHEMRSTWLTSWQNSCTMYSKPFGPRRLLTSWRD